MENVNLATVLYGFASEIATRRLYQLNYIEAMTLREYEEFSNYGVF